MSQHTEQQLSGLTLGKTVEYVCQYQPTLLQGVPRKLNRDELALPDTLPFEGEDLWNGYELSWLNSKGKPCIGLLRCAIPATSPNLVESKSFKLYLNSFNQTRFASVTEVQQHLQQDLSQCAGQGVRVEVLTGEAMHQQAITRLPGDCIDELDISIDSYDLSPALLQTDGDTQVSETLHSHLLKSNCLITHQPDWGSVMIRYQGPKINRESLLRYIISFRQHNEFHEQCVERIFMDIKRLCGATKLSVCARYTRRGGLDINPFRSDFEAPYKDLRLARQ